jgi:hypothetical protein
MDKKDTIGNKVHVIKSTLTSCIFRCVSAIVGGSEYTRVEREQRINSLSNGHTDELQEAELPSRVSAEANIKSSMQIYVKLSAGIVLDSWNDTSRYWIDLVHTAFLDFGWQRFYSSFTGFYMTLNAGHTSFQN